jgi:hypothetical protein
MRWWLFQRLGVEPNSAYSRRKKKIFSFLSTDSTEWPPAVRDGSVVYVGLLIRQSSGGEKANHRLHIPNF